jgi:hypothetical protein
LLPGCVDAGKWPKRTGLAYRGFPDRPPPTGPGRTSREVPIARSKGPFDLVRYSHLGIQFALVVGLAIFGGVWLDRRFSTRGIFVLLGTFVGAGIGFYLLLREIRSIEANSDNTDGADHGSRGARVHSDDPDRRE